MVVSVEEIVKNPGVIEGMVTLIIAVLAALTGLVTVSIKKLNATLHQVENGHGPSGKDDNLRDQMDRIEHTMTSGFRRLDKQHGETHRVLTQEVEDRQALERAKGAEHQRMWQAIDELRKKEDGS